MGVGRSLERSLVIFMLIASNGLPNVGDWCIYLQGKSQIGENMLDEMDVVYGWFERTRDIVEDNILGGKIVPIGCLVQFQALGSIADYLSVHTLQFGYKLGLVDARAVVELMTDREQRGI